MGRSKIIDFLDDLIDGFLDMVPFLAILGFFAAAIAIFASGALWLNSKHCTAAGDKMGIEVEFSAFTGCMIRVKGTWLPWSEVIPVERDGKIVFEPKPVVRLKGE
jgi:hypothetical protein